MFRELYSEKMVVAEERRARVDNSPLGRFVEAFCGAAFANAYSHPVIGMSAFSLAEREKENFQANKNPLPEETFCPYLQVDQILPARPAAKRSGSRHDTVQPHRQPSTTAKHRSGHACYQWSRDGFGVLHAG